MKLPRIWESEAAFCCVHFAWVLCFLSAGSADATGQGIRATQSAPTLRRASELRSQHKLAEAAALLRAHVVMEPGDADALVLLAEVDHDAKNDDEAKSLLLQALTLHPRSRPANVILGKLLLEEAHYPEAMDRFEAVLAVTPQDAEARQLEWQAAQQLSLQAQQGGRPDAALKVLEHARLSLPDDPRLLLDLGLQAFDLNLLPEAEEALQKAHGIKPHDPDTVYGLARVELEERHMRDAETHLREYLAMRPNDASAHFGLGHVLAMQQQDDAARTEFLRSIQLQPAQTESYYQVGELDRKERKDAEARALFEKVIARDPRHGGALAGLGELAYRAKDYANAEAYCSRAVQAAPDYATAHYFHGLALARLDRKAEADVEFKAAMQLDKTTTVPAASAPEAPKP